MYIHTHLLIYTYIHTDTENSVFLNVQQQRSPAPTPAPDGLPAKHDIPTHTDKSHSVPNAQERETRHRPGDG